MAQRYRISDFELANPLYVGATVSAYTVDGNGNKTSTLASLYADETSSTALTNPQVLDSEGKFAQKVYADDNLILTISGISAGDHDTGIIRPGVDQSEVYAALAKVQAIAGDLQSAAADARESEVNAAASAAEAAAAVNGLKWRPSVRAASSTNVNLASAPSSFDGVTATNGDRILPFGQTAPAENGVYIFNGAGQPMTRATDADTWLELVSQVVTVEEGSTWADYSLVCQINQGGTLGVTAVIWGTLKIVIPDASVTPAKLTTDARKQFIEIAASDETTPLTAGNSKISFRMPYAFTLTAVRASLSTGQTSGSIMTVDVNEGGSSILSTKITIDNGEKTSFTAAIQPAISDSTLADDAEITIDIDQVGDGTAKGLKVTLIGYPS